MIGMVKIIKIKMLITISNIKNKLIEWLKKEKYPSIQTK